MKFSSVTSARPYRAAPTLKRAGPFSGVNEAVFMCDKSAESYPLEWKMRVKRLPAVIITASLVLTGSATLPAEQVTVRYAEGVVHALLALRSPDGTVLAGGDLTQTVRDIQVTARLVLRFKDGSLHDETTIFSQRDRFRLLSDHVVQKGPAFPRQLDMTINAESGQVTVRYKDDDGKEKVEDEKLDLPPDLANGIMPVLLKNVSAGHLPPSVSYLAATPKPRLVKVALAVTGVESIAVAGSSRRATHYVARVDIGGMSGALAPIFGKQPPDNHLWILEGESPAFLRSEGPLYVGGPSWRIELTSPPGPAAPPAAK
jgi:hypothetical protein